MLDANDRGRFMTHLSKSKLISGSQCGKRLWLEKYQPDLVEHSAATEAMFAVGNEVGEIAQALFPEGVLVEHNFELDKALLQTEDLLAQAGAVTIFEATFQHEGVLIRADVFIRDEVGRVRVAEVKSSTQVKEYHENDCAIQLWVMEGCGIEVDRIELAHIDNTFIYPGGGDYHGLLHFADVTDVARSKQSFVPELVDEMRVVLDGPEPEIPMGPQCTSPFKCSFIDYCKGPQTTEMPIEWLGGGRSAVEKYNADDIHDIGDIPEGYLTNEKREWMRSVAVSGEPDLKPEAKQELANIGWPRYYFDFETVGPAVPKFAGTRPYGSYAFQWSCHIQQDADQTEAELEHVEFLASGKAAPARETAEAMIKALGTEGPILVYSSFEKGVIKGFIEAFPDIAEELGAIKKRLFDLLPVTQRNYYHPDMKGSWSIKAVLPTVSDLSYGDLSLVTAGTEAGIRWLEMIQPDIDATGKEELRQALLSYCELDTLAMVRLAWFLDG